MLYRLSYVSVPVDLAPRPNRPNGVLLRKTHREPTICFVYYLLPTFLSFTFYLLPFTFIPFTYYLLPTTYLRLSLPTYPCRSLYCLTYRGLPPLHMSLRVSGNSDVFRLRLNTLGAGSGNRTRVISLEG